MRWLGCAGMVAILACQSNEVVRLDFGAADAADAVHQQETAAETPDAPSFLRTGSPCTDQQASECFGGFCLTTEFVAALDPKAQVPGGACSKLGCATDDECGPGAFCLSGIPDLPFPICLPRCETFEDCRYAEGYVCFGAEELGDVRACLPASIIVLFRCGDGVCDASEQANPDLCPEDCR